MVKIYHNPKCSKSRQALEILNSKNLNPEIILYLEKGLKFSEIKNILNLLNLSVMDIIRKKENEFKERNLSDQSLSENDLINEIINFPKLLERPIIINDQKAIIARPSEKLLLIL